MVFIDGSNLYHVLTQICGRHDLRFGKFIEKLANGRDLIRAYYYNVRQDRQHNPTAAQEQERFLASLETVPYMETRLGIYKQRGQEMVEKGVDVMIATDLVSGAFKNLYDTAILVSGDGDFFPAIEAAKGQGKHVEVAAFENNLSPEAERAADLTTLLRPAYFTTLWTSRSRAASRSSTGSNRPAGRAGRPGDNLPLPAPPEAEEAVDEVERQEDPAPADEKEAGEDEAQPQRERRRYGRRRRGQGSGTRSEAPREAAQSAEPKQTTEPRPARAPLRPPKLRSPGGERAPSDASKSEPAKNAQADSNGGTAKSGEGSSNGTSAVTIEPSQHVGWFRRRLGLIDGPGQQGPNPASAV